jgi:hypothetical protein
MKKKEMQECVLHKRQPKSRAKKQECEKVRLGCALLNMY